MGERTQSNLEKCTIVVSSCDKYEELWKPFFKLLKLSWMDVPCPIVLNTESKNYVDESVKVRCLHPDADNGKLNWGGRLKRILRQIDTEYVLFLLDDFFVDGWVDKDKIADCIRWMDEDSSISVFSFMEVFADKYNDKRYPGFERRKLIGEYKFNCQAGIWRRKHLIQYLRNGESPWEWEVYGNWRSYRMPHRKFYAKAADAPPIIPYLFEANNRNYGGLVLFRGKWYLPVVNYFIEKYRLEIDLSGRPTMTEEELVKLLSPAETVVKRPRWKEKLLFLRPIWWKALKMKEVLVHIKHFF